jgi:arylsulfatase A-like enzyme
MPPSVVWVCTDQHNFRALSCAGHPDVETPNVDRLAERGVQFTDAYCPSPVCGPSRAALFSGLYPRANGVTGNWESFEGDPALLPELLRDAGYDTALAGKLHFEPKAKPHGFTHRRHHDAMYDCYHAEEPWNSAYVEWLADRRFGGGERGMERTIERANRDERALQERDDLREFLLGTNWRTEAEHSNTWVTDRSVEYLREHREEPFFLFTSYFGPHQPMLAPGRWAEMYDPADIELPAWTELSPVGRPVAETVLEDSSVFGRYEDWTEDDYREVLAAYYGQVSMIDHGVGRILDALEAAGVRDDTIVVFTADHGDHNAQFGWFHKGTMYEGAARVPLVVDDPSGAGGVDCERVVNTLGLFRTILDRAGVDGPATHSQSLAPLLDDPGAAWTDETYSELGDQAMLVDGDRKLVRATPADGPDAVEFYDRTERPHDATDRSEDPDVEGVVAEMEERLAERYAEYGSA